MWISFDYRSDKQASQPGHDIPDRPAQAVKPAHLPAASAGTSILFASPTAAPDHHLVHRLFRVGRPPPFVHNSQSQWMGGTIILLLAGPLRHHPFGRGTDARRQCGPQVVEKSLADSRREIPSHEVRRGPSRRAAIQCP